MKSGAKNLGAAAAKGALATFGGQGARVIVQIIGLAILARMLSPADYGLMAMAMVVVGLADVFRDFGLSMAVIQAKIITRRQRNILFWISSAIGLVLALLISLLAWPISKFYGDFRLNDMFFILSLVFIFNGMASQYRAQLGRYMKFKQLATVDVFSQVAGLFIAVFLARFGFDYWALVWQQVGQAFVGLCVLVYVSGWLPGVPRFGTNVSHLFGYSKNLLGTQLIVYFSRSFDSLVVGWQIGPSELGIYNRAHQFLMLPLNQINAPATRVAVPVLSRLNDNPKKYFDFVLFGQSIIVNLVLIFFIFFIVNADLIIRLGLGGQWGDAVPIFQILAVGGCFQVSGYIAYWIFLSKGLTHENLKYTAVTRPLLIFAIMIGANWGVLGVAAGYSVGCMILWLLGVLWIGVKTGLDSIAMLKNGARPLFAALFMAAPAYYSLVALGLVGTMAGAFVSVLVGLVAMISLSLLWPAYRADLNLIISAKKYLL